MTNYQATEVRFLRRFNLGNYEHEEISITVVVSENGKADIAIQKARELVEKSFKEAHPNAKTN